MLRAANTLRGYTIAAVDGNAGRLDDFLFEEGTWRLRCVVAGMGASSVLLSPEVLGSFDAESKTLAVGLNLEQVEASTPLLAETDPRWAPEFATRHLDAAGSAPAPVDLGEARPTPETCAGAGLRSVREINDYSIRARDGEFGRLDDLILDDEDWLIRYLLVNTAKFWPSRGVIVATGWVKRIDSAASAVEIDLTSEAIRRSPPFDPSKPVNREYEQKLYEHYGRTYDRR